MMINYFSNFIFLCRLFSWNYLGLQQVKEASLSTGAVVTMTANINASCITPRKITSASNVVSWSLNNVVTSQTSSKHFPGPFVCHNSELN